MPVNACKAKTHSGQRCKLNASETGYCHLHDPQKIAAREEQVKTEQKERDKKWQKGNPLREVLEAVHKTCEAKGWESHTSSLDEENWRYATVSVERSVLSGYPSETITGFFEVTIDGGVQVCMNKTSFHAHGLQALHSSILADLGRLPWLESPKKTRPSSTHESLALERLLKRFHIVARLLKNRYSDRETIIIEDEYDVQDLLHALLRTLFDDVRPEEYAPSYAGSSSRVDFLLKGEKTVVEAKMASRTLRDKTIGEQLIIDIKRYQSHPDCKRLVCFVYDPDNRVKNPVAIESDLTGKHDKVEVKVFVVPH